MVSHKVERIRSILAEAMAQTPPLSARLPIPPVAERTLDQHLLWLDVLALERDMAMLREENTRLSSQFVCRFCLNETFVPPVDEIRRVKRRMTQQAQKRAEFQAKRRMALPKGMTEEYSGEIDG